MNLENILKQIKKDYFAQVEQKFDLEIMNWIDYEQMEEEGYTIEYDFYKEYSNNEAEDVIYEEMISHWEHTHNNGKKLNSHNRVRLYELLEETYQL